jgi:uncharacterized Zn ribbon protein
VVKTLPRHLKVKGSSLDTDAGTSRDKNSKSYSKLPSRSCIVVKTWSRHLKVKGSSLDTDAGTRRKKIAKIMI